MSNNNYIILFNGVDWVEIQPNQFIYLTFEIKYLNVKILSSFTININKIITEKIELKYDTL